MRKPLLLTSLMTASLIASLAAGVPTAFTQAEPTSNEPAIVSAAAQPATTFEASPAPAATPANDSSGAALNSLSELSLTAMPTRLGDDNSLQIAPGEKKQVTLKVFNNSNADLTITSQIEDFIVGEDGKTPVPVSASEEDNRWSMRDWVTVTPARQTIKSKQTAAMTALIEVPEDALPGGHFAMVTHQVVSSLDAAGESAETTGVNQRVGTLLYVIVPGNIREEAFIRNFFIPGFQELGPVPFSFTIDNDSDIHIQPNVKVEIFNFFGKKIFSSPVDTQNIFPKSSRDFAGIWGQIWGFGRYRAEVTAVYGTTGATKVVSTFFWLFPLSIVLSILILLLTLIAVAILIRRHAVSKRSKEQLRLRELEDTVARLTQEKSSGDDSHQT